MKFLPPYRRESQWHPDNPALCPVGAARTSILRGWPPSLLKKIVERIRQIPADLPRHRRTADLLATVAVIPLLRHQHPVPAQNRIGVDEGTDLLQFLAAKHLGFGCQTPTLVVIEEDASLAELFLEYPIFGTQVFDHVLLLAIHPAGQDYEQKLSGLQDETHGAIRAD